MTDPITRLNAALEGRYRIERELGQGGMATVYLADDLRHERKVALKVLKPELAAVVGADRFLAEIKTTANLQHPNILPLFDSGEADSFLFYVMPYVAGESLRERLDREKQLPVAEAVRIASDMAEALHHAHREGVVHRDIKPGNILLRDGRPLIADFGIALAVQEAGGGRLTETGLSLGTPYYMSPEQATADRDPDARADIYSLGCVLYEMLTGEPPHTGTTAQAVLGKILTTDPTPPTEHRRSIPPHVESVILCSLEKLPADRFSSAEEFAAALNNERFVLSRSASRTGAFQATKTLTIGLGIAVVAATAVAVLGWLRTTTYTPLMYDVALPDSAPMRLYMSESYSIPEDGSFVVYEAATTPPQLWRRDLSTGEAGPIPGTENASGPIVSPAGDRILFMQNGQMHTSGPDGQGRITLSEFDAATGHFWLADGRVAVMDRDGTLLRWYDGERQVRADTTLYCIQPEPITEERFLCAGGGDQFAYVVELTDEQAMEEVVHLADDPNGEALLRGADFTIVDERYLVYVSREGDLRAATINWQTLTVGRSALLVPGLRREAYSGLGHYQITADGSLFYTPGANASVGLFVERRGDADPTPIPIRPERFLRFSISSDGSRFAAVVDGVDAHELRTYDVNAGWRDLGTWYADFWVGHPAWNADGSKLVVDAQEGLVVPGNLLIGSPRDATYPEVVLSNLDPEFGFWPTHYVSDRLIVGYGEFLTTVDVTEMPPKVDTLTSDPTWFSVTSPDTRWVALADWGDYTIRIAPFPGLDREFTITENGVDPRWLSPSELVYYGKPGQSFYRMQIDTVTGQPLGDPKFWFNDPRFAETPGPSYTVGPGGSVIYLQSIGEVTASYLRVIPNWVQQMKRAVDEANR